MFNYNLSLNFVSVVVLLLSFKLINAEKNPIVSAPFGNVEGIILTSSNGREIWSFRGIPYAKPPVGDLRFKPPEIIEPSNETIDGTKEGPACPQAGEVPSISEDCLTLNVYTEKLTSQSDKKRPVIFFMHPGGFYAVSGQSLFYGPKYLIDHNVVLVTINYRLGSLGFLSTGDELSPGNNGFKDQVVALKWVQQNIESFGGDPGSVTIVGYSAGAVSVTLHMVSPMSKGLFHRAVSMSGTSTSNWKISTNQLDLAKKQADLVGCPSDTSKQILDCLRTKDSRTISKSYRSFFEFNYDPILIWTPVIEPDCGQERFLPDDPIKLIQQGKFSKVPLIIGMTEYEFAGPAYDVIRNESLRTEMNKDWYRIAPLAFLYERDTARSRAISDKLKNYYLQSKDVENDERSIKGLRELYADGVISFGVHRFTKLMEEYNDKPVFYYRFSYIGRNSHFYLSENNPLGAVHHDDLLYLFDNKIFPEIEKNHTDFNTIIRLTKMWTDFAKVGNPTPKRIEVLDNKIWPIYTHTKPNYLDIGSTITIGNCLYCDRFMIWEKLFPLSEH